MATVTTRALRENLRATLARAARGERVTVTRRGKSYVCVVAAGQAAAGAVAHPLRGSVLAMADDFDAPLDALWDATHGDTANVEGTPPPRSEASTRGDSSRRTRRRSTPP